MLLDDVPPDKWPSPAPSAILPGRLYVGGDPAFLPSGWGDWLRYRYSLIVSCTKEGPPLSARLWPQVIHFPMDDVPWSWEHDSDGQRHLAEIGALIANHIQRGGRVLVHCRAGLNRSGLVAAVALLFFGLSPRDAIAAVRNRRSPLALSNRTFETFLRRVGP